MSTLAKLTKFEISYYLKPRFDNKKERNKFLLILLALSLCFIFPIIMVIGSVYMGTAIAIKQGILPELLSTLFTFVQLSTIILGAITYINIMYFSRDNMLLASLPVRNSHIYISKMVVCLISILALTTLMVVPSIIAVAIACAKAGLRLGAEFYIIGLLSIIILPLIALMLISIIVFPLMKIVSFLKKRPVLFSVCSVVFALAIMTLMYSFGFIVGGDNSDIIATIKIMANIGKYSYATLVIARSMLGSQILINMLILIGILIGSVIISVGLSSLLLKSTLTTLDEGGINKGSKKSVEIAKQQNPIIADIKRELTVIMRSPELFIQTLMMIIMAPLLIIIFAILGNEAPQTDEKVNVAIFFTAMTFFYQSITIGLNYLANIGISRERDMLSILKTLPFKSSDIIKAKLYIADVATVIMALLCAVVYYIFSKDTPWFSGIFMFLLVTIQGMTLNAYSLYRDAKKPNLKWMNVKEITKNNFGAIIPMFISMAIGILLSIIAGGLSYGGLSNNMTFLVFWLIVAVLETIFFFVFRFKRVEKIVELFDKIEN